MNEQGTPDQKIKQREMIQTRLVDSPSENYLVAEHLRRAPNLMSRGILYIMVLTLIGGWTYSVASKVDVVVECLAVARPAFTELRVISPMDGRVERVLVEEGQSVEKDAPLFLIAAGEGRRWIRAERAGTVLGLNVKETGSEVRASSILCSVLPSEGLLYMDIVVENKDIGIIEPGMAIKYKFDAFPQTEYGILSGAVRTIPSSAVEDRAQRFVFHLHGTLDDPYFEMKGKRYSIRAGMTAIAEITTDRRSLYSLLMRRMGG
jgi:multidrug efflux pump subunit AcrA (membrane-fusion protein)